MKYKKSKRFGKRKNNGVGDNFKKVSSNSQSLKGKQSIILAPRGGKRL